jgi:hypothetical protein
MPLGQQEAESLILLPEGAKNGHGSQISVVEPPRYNIVTLPQLRYGIWRDSDNNVWYLRNSKLIPIVDSELEKLFGRMRRTPAPEAGMEEGRRNDPKLLIDACMFEFLHDWWSSNPLKHASTFPSPPPVLTEWRERIWAPTSPEDEQLERTQLDRFIAVMGRHWRTGEVEPEDMPDFTYEEISCWRIFLQLFPQSVGLLETASKVERLSDTKRMALALLSSAVATTDDHEMSDRARKVVGNLLQDIGGSNVSTYEEYQVVRQFLYAAVEAEKYPVGEMLRFLRQYRKENWEVKLNRVYYKDKDSTDIPFGLSIMTKCDRPLPRDERTKKISEYHRDRVLPKSVIDAVKKKTR